MCLPQARAARRGARGLWQPPRGAHPPHSAAPALPPPRPQRLDSCAACRPCRAARRPCGGACGGARERGGGKRPPNAARYGRDVSHALLLWPPPVWPPNAARYGRDGPRPRPGGGRRQWPCGDVPGSRAPGCARRRGPPLRRGRGRGRPLTLAAPVARRDRRHRGHCIGICKAAPCVKIGIISPHI